MEKAQSDPNAEIVPGGKHPYKIKGPKGSMPISDHKKPYGKGLRCAMRKQWLAIGLGPVLLLWLLLQAF